MHKRTVGAAGLALVAALVTANLQAAPRITAQVDAKPNATLTAEEQRAVSVAAGRLLRHTYNARVALAAGDKAKAAAQIAKAQELVAIIENAVPSYTVKSRITSGDLSYVDDDTLKPTIIPIFHELDKVSLEAPLRQAKAEKDKAAGGAAKSPPVGVASDVLKNVRVTLDLGLAKAGLDTARRVLDKGNTKAAEQALAAAMASLSFSEVEVGLPLDQARENLMLAKAAIKAGDIQEAKAVLGKVDKELSDYANGAGEQMQKDIAKLRKEMEDLSGKLEDSPVKEQLVSTIEGWWDRIGKLMH